MSKKARAVEIIPDNLDSSGEERVKNALAVRPDATLVLTPVMNLDIAKKRLQEFQEFVKFYLQEGEDFGIIPGTEKPTLYKPGADKLCELYGLGDSYRILTQTENFEADPPLFDYTIECQLWRGERLVSTGLGSCNSYESKYKLREIHRKCPSCGAEAIIKGKKEYGGGWVCWKKRHGCGKSFSDGDKSIEGQDAGKAFNDDLPTLKNTILKMAKKRAKVDATLAATRSSGVFTQDMEDIHGPSDADRDTGSQEKANAVAQRKIEEAKARGAAEPKKAPESNMSDFGRSKPVNSTKPLETFPAGTMAPPKGTVEDRPAQNGHAVQEVAGPMEYTNWRRENGAPLKTSTGAPYLTVIVGGRKFYAFRNPMLPVNGREQESLHDILKRLPIKAYLRFTAHSDPKGYWSIEKVFQLGELEWDDEGMSVLRRDASEQGRSL